MYQLPSNHKTALSNAWYDPETGQLKIEFDYERVLNDPNFNHVRDIDSVVVNGKVYDLELHAIDGPRDGKGFFIYDDSTVQNTFNLNVDKGLTPEDGQLTLRLMDDPDGTGEISKVSLVSTTPPAKKADKPTAEVMQQAQAGGMAAPETEVATKLASAHKGFSFSTNDGFAGLGALHATIWGDGDANSVPVDMPAAKVATKTKVKAQPKPANGDLVFAINIGGENSVKAKDGTVFKADTTGVGEMYWDGKQIKGTRDDGVFHSHAWSPKGLSYNFKVDNGTYLVELYHAEIYEPNAAEGMRVFDVRLENKLVASNLDVFKAAGGANTAYTSQYKVYVKDGTLSIRLKNEVENAMLSGLKVTRVEDLALNAGPMEFGLLDLLL